MRPYGPTALRVCVGGVFLAHGAQKLFGLWGGPGLSGTIAMVKGLGLPIPYPMALTALAIVLALTEFLGGIFLILGAVTRWVAIALLVDIGVAVWKVHYPHGFFLSTSGHGHGVEFALVLIGALFCLVLTGPGAFSIDEGRSQRAEAQARGRARMRKV